MCIFTILYLNNIYVFVFDYFIISYTSFILSEHIDISLYTLASKSSLSLSVKGGPSKWVLFLYLSY